MKKIIYITGSALIGLIALLSVMFILIGSGTVGVANTTLVFSSSDATAVYDGNELTAPKWKMEEGTLKDGHKASVKVSGRQNAVGESPNYLTVTVFDENGADVTEYYNIECRPGTLKVTERPLELVAGSASKEYDGKALKCEEFSVLSGSLSEGHEIKTAFSGEIVEAGAILNELSARVVDASGNDVTDNYAIRCIYGSLTVNKRQLTLKSDTKEKKYDGLTLTSESYSIIEGSVVDTHSISVEASGRITGVGEVTNSFSAAVYDAMGKDVSHNYDITYIFGTLRVTPVRLIIRTDSESKVYDGTVLESDEWVVYEGETATGESLVAEFGEGIATVGKISNNAVFTVKNAAGIDTTKNYVIEVVSGVLEVIERELIITSGSQSKLFDGRILEDNTFTLDEKTSLADGHSIDISFTSSITSVGSVDNEYSVIIRDENELDVTANYKITAFYGKLTVTKPSFTIVSHSDEKVYDGKELKVERYDVLNDAGELIDGEFIAEGLRAIFDFKGSIVGIGTVENKFSIKILNSDDKDVTDNFDITLEYGSLTVTSASLSFISRGAEKVYDGTPLTNGLVEAIDEDGNVIDLILPEGHSAVFDVTGSITNAGLADNTYTVTIFNADGEDVTANFDIGIQTEQLSVTLRDITVQLTGYEDYYDGKEHSASYEIIDDPENEYDGLATDHIINVIKKNMVEDATNGGVEHGYEFDITDASGESVLDNYNFILLGEDEEIVIRSRKISVSTDNYYGIYDGQSHTADYVVLNPDVLDFMNELGHKIVVESQPSVLDATDSPVPNLIVFDVLDANGESVKDNYRFIFTEIGELHVSPVVYFMESPSAEKFYDGKPLQSLPEELIHNSSLVDGDEYYIASMASLTDVGSINNYFEIIFLRNGVNISSNYDVIVDYGTLTVKSNKLTITSFDDSKVYDGTALENSGYTVDGELMSGHTLLVHVTGQITRAGNTQNVFNYFVVDESGEDVSRLYDITPIYGNLVVTPAPLTITTGNAVKQYDGEPISNSDYFVEGLVNGDSAVVKVTGKLTDVYYRNGQVSYVQNSFTHQVYNSQGENVTDCYDLNPLYGELWVMPRTLVITSLGASQTYNGKPLSKDGYQLLSGTLVAGHTLEFHAFTEMTDVLIKSASTKEIGTIKNDYTVSIKDEKGKNVTGNYAFEKHYGELFITPIRLEVKTDTAYKIYDGTPLLPPTDPGWSLDPATQPLDGHTITNVVLPNSITDLGSVLNTVTFDVMDGNRVVTNNYAINGTFGSLFVTARIVTVRSESDAKDYDGTELTNDTWKIVGTTQLVQGHSLDITVTGTRTEIGESQNTFVVNGIVDEGGNDVTRNYQIEKELGALVVRGKDNTSQSPAPGGGLQEDANNKDNGEEENPHVVLELYSQQSGQVYMRWKSFGDYYLGNGSTVMANWTAGPEYGKTLDGKYSYNYLSGIALEKSGLMSSNELKIKNYTTDQLLPAYLDNDALKYEIPRSDVHYGSRVSEEYSVYYFNYGDHGAGLSGSLGEYRDEELAYRQFVRNNYLYVDTETRAYMNKVIAQNGLTGSSSALISKVASFIQGSARYNLEYDRALDMETNPVISFLDEYKEGVCRHYAQAATLLFRTLGYPARYTIGYSANTEEYKWTTIMSDRGHAWVEVYLNGIGWITVEVTGSDGSSEENNGNNGNNGGNTDTRPKLTISPVNQYVNGSVSQTLRASGKIKGLQNYTEENGYRYEAEVKGEQKGYGISYAEIVEGSFKLYDPDGVDITDRFNISFGKGTLQIYAYEITIRSGSASKIYDGTPLISNDCELISGELGQGHSFKILETNASQTSVGNRSNTFTVQIMDQNGNTKFGNGNINDLYKINKVHGSLEVTHRHITVTADSDSLTEPGDTPLTCNTYKITGSLCNGHYEVVVIEGSISNYGRTTNRVKSVKIYDANGKDVTQNYSIKTVNGLLQIYPE